MWGDAKKIFLGGGGPDSPKTHTTYTHMYKFKPFHILFYLEQLTAVVFGKQECRGMYIY